MGIRGCSSAIAHLKIIKLALQINGSLLSNGYLGPKLCRIADDTTKHRILSRLLKLFPQAIFVVDIFVFRCYMPIQPKEIA